MSTISPEFYKPQKRLCRVGDPSPKLSRGVVPLLIIMLDFLTYFSDFLLDRGLSPESAAMLTLGAGLGLLAIMAWAANWVAKRIILRAATGLIRRSSATWDDILIETGVFTRLSHLAPALIVHAFGDDVFGGAPAIRSWINGLVTVYLIVIGLAVLSATLNSILLVAAKNPAGARLPLKGFVQAVKLVAFIVGGIFILSVLFGKTPVFFLSGLGALTAVLMLIFKDAILGFVAGIQISVNQMVQIGDWIEMPKAGADGFVIDVSLTTVKVSNWDKTITTIPTYALISESFKNWRGMQASGGRRIKRAIYIDLQTVGFATEEDLSHWRKFRLLQSYLDAKLAEIAEESARLPEDLGVLGNGRRLTNIGTFRAYCTAYLRAHPHIHQTMTFLVRQLQPTEHGLPLEIYVFVSDVRWAIYEGVQADIFDHLLAVMPQFGLSVFQRPAGQDMRAALVRKAEVAPLVMAAATRPEEPAPAVIGSVT